MRGGDISIGEGSKIDDTAKIGIIPADGKKRPLSIGKDSVIRPYTSVYLGSEIGDRLQTGHCTLIREDNKIGKDVSVGTNSELGPGNTIGNNVRIHTGCFLEHATVEDNVFMGPGVVMANDLHPICPKRWECRLGGRIMEGAKIGANSTILPGVKIGKGSLVGAGSVVTKDVPDGSVAVGNPARVTKKVKELKCEKGFYETPYEWERR